MRAKEMKEKNYYRYKSDLRSLIAPIDKTTLQKLLTLDTDSTIVFNLTSRQLELIDDNVEVVEVPIHFEL